MKSALGKDRITIEEQYQGKWYYNSQYTSTERATDRADEITRLTGRATRVVVTPITDDDRKAIRGVMWTLGRR